MECRLQSLRLGEAVLMDFSNIDLPRNVKCRIIQRNYSPQRENKVSVGRATDTSTTYLYKMLKKINSTLLSSKLTSLFHISLLVHLVTLRYSKFAPDNQIINEL